MAEVHGRSKSDITGRLFISAAFVAAAIVVAVAFRHYVDVRYREGIVVSGSATRRIRSDRAIWTVSVIARGATVAEAYSILARDIPRVRRFLIDNQVSESDIRIEAVSTRELHALSDQGYEIESQIIGYSLTQEVKVISNDVDLVERVARNVTQVIEDGVYVVSSPPEFIHSDLGDIKVLLVGEATGDARARAAQVAEHSQGELGELISANVGVVQVNAANETQVSWEGVYNRSSIEKDVMVVVRTVFALR